ncbi:MAG TPA: hypothetical protein VNO23_10390 [Candidatus Binatia bacterium]|nr:hypothetical protein [Candidatus Binatia bacterium]
MNSTVTAALALLAAVVLAAPAAGEHGALGEPDRERRGAVPDDQATPQRIEGKVVALDVENGRVLLATDAGVLAVQADPEDIADLRVGDTIEVVMVDDEFDAEPPEPQPRV